MVAYLLNWICDINQFFRLFILIFVYSCCLYGYVSEEVFDVCLNFSGACIDDKRIKTLVLDCAWLDVISGAVISTYKVIIKVLTHLHYICSSHFHEWMYVDAQELRFRQL